MELCEADFLNPHQCAHPYNHPYNFTEYVPQIYGGGCPVSNSLLLLLQNTYRIRTVITLTDFPIAFSKAKLETIQGCAKFVNERESFVPEANLLDNVTMTFFHFPIMDGTTPSLALCKTICDCINEYRQLGGVYIHCWRGNGRTRTIIGSYLRYKLDMSQGDMWRTLSKINRHGNYEYLAQVQTHYLDSIVIPKDSIEKHMHCVLNTNRSQLWIGKFSKLFEKEYEKGEEYDFDKAVSDLKLGEKPPIVLYGKTVYQARDVGFYSNESKGYEYSHQLMPSQPLTPELAELLNLVNEKFMPSDAEKKFNGILVNRYNSGSDYISAHSDDEKSLGTCGVVSISLGATRNFRIRSKGAIVYDYYGREEERAEKAKAIVGNFDLGEGTVAWMQGDFQSEFTHEIPKQARIKKPRISLTFRCHLE